MNHLTIALAYKDNPHMLVEQLRALNTYPLPLQRLTRLIVVDDCSPKYPAHETVLAACVGPFELEIYRILGEPIPWGQLRARNLGVHIAPPGSWVLATDIDHVLPAECALKLLEFEPEDGCYYTFARRNAPKDEPTNPHANSYLMQREWFFETVGGCHERAVGYYGTDSIFRARAALFGASQALPSDIWLRVYNRNGVDIGGIPGAATNLPRKGSRFHAKNNETIRLWMKRAHLERAHPDHTLQFQWTRTR